MSTGRLSNGSLEGLLDVAVSAYRVRVVKCWIRVLEHGGSGKQRLCAPGMFLFEVKNMLGLTCGMCLHL